MKLTGIVAWAFVTKPKPAGKYEGIVIPSVYSVNLMLDTKTAKALKEKGFNVKRNKKDIPGIENAAGKPFLIIKKPAEYEGVPTTPPEVVDSKLQPFTGLIGNGSKVNVVFAASEWVKFGKSGTAAKLRKVQVVDLVDFAEDEDLEDFGEEDGFVAEKKAAAGGDDFDVVDEDLDDLPF